MIIKLTNFEFIIKCLISSDLWIHLFLKLIFIMRGNNGNIILECLNVLLAKGKQEFYDRLLT